MLTHDKQAITHFKPLTGGKLNVANVSMELLTGFATIHMKHSPYLICDPSDITSLYVCVLECIIPHLHDSFSIVSDTQRRHFGK